MLLTTTFTPELDPAPADDQNQRLRFRLNEEAAGSEASSDDRPRVLRPRHAPQDLSGDTIRIDQRLRNSADRFGN